MNLKGIRKISYGGFPNYKLESFYNPDSDPYSSYNKIPIKGSSHKRPTLSEDKKTITITIT